MHLCHEIILLELLLLLTFNVKLILLHLLLLLLLGLGHDEFVDILLATEGLIAFFYFWSCFILNVLLSDCFL